MFLFVFSACAFVAVSYAATGDKNQAVLDLFLHSYKGDGTYYGNTLDGTCQFSNTYPPAATDPKVRALVALNRPQFMGSLMCGLCLRVVGTGNGLGTDPIRGDYIVFVKDLCPVCVDGDVDFALDGDGRWDIEMQAVQCPVGNTKIQYAFQGSNLWYIKLQVRNTRIPVTTVELQRQGQWITATHSIDGYWVVSGAGTWQSGNVPVRLTAANGQVLNDIIPQIQNDVIMEGLNHVQVALDQTLPSA